jgi:hypothetical protein
VKSACFVTPHADLLSYAALFKHQSWSKRLVAGLKRVQLHHVYLPPFIWLRTYNWRTELPGDLNAGLVVGILLLPQVRDWGDCFPCQVCF